jgi:hypothetical protein
MGLFDALCRPCRPEDTGVVTTAGADADAHGTNVRDGTKEEVRKQQEKQSRNGQMSMISPRSLRGLLSSSSSKKSRKQMKLSESEKNTSGADAGNADLEDRKQISKPRKSFPTFNNTHPIQENVKDKMEKIEKALKGEKLDVSITQDTTEVSEDVEYVMVKPNEPVVDTDHDPWQNAYEVWYRKGLLHWRPKSIDEEDNVALGKNGSNVDISGHMESPCPFIGDVVEFHDEKTPKATTSGTTISTEMWKENETPNARNQRTPSSHHPGQASASTPKTPSSSRSFHQSVEDLKYSRVSSLTKSKKAPMVSIFG